jgi:acyl-CoA thioester hydrolase
MKQIEATLADFPHHRSIEARFSDLDRNDHINNIAIAGMFGEARNALIRAMFDGTERPGDFHFVVGQAAVRYVREATWPNVFTIGTGVIDLGTCL